MIGEHTSNQPSDGDRSQAPRSKPNWSRPPGAKAPTPVPFDSYDHKNLEDRPAPPEAFVRRLSKFLGDEMAPVLTPRGEIWRWNLHPGSGVLTLPWPRHWTFRRKASREDSHPLRDHVVVGSWKVPANALDWWIASAETTACNGLSRERLALRSRGEDPSWVPRWFSITVLPPGQNWMEPAAEDVHLLIAGCEELLSGAQSRESRLTARSFGRRGPCRAGGRGHNVSGPVSFIERLPPDG